MVGLTIDLSVGLCVELEIWRPAGNILITPPTQKMATEVVVLWETCLAKHKDTQVS